MQITVKTSQFEFAHGKKPRGQGGWFFNFPHVNQGSENATFFVNGTYGDAVKKAKARAAELGTSTVVVCS